MKSTVVLLFFYVLINSSAHGIPQKVTNNFNQNAIVFPTEDTNKNHTSASHNRQPVIDRRRCNEASELLYPGDIPGDCCDCKPGYLYVPNIQKCFLAFTKGPCPDQHFLYKDEASSIPKCIENPCRQEGLVYFNSKCYQLNGEQGCEEYKKLIGRKVILTVDPTTLQLQCRDEDDKFRCDNFCCRGGIRDSIGKCDKQKSIQ